MKKLLSIDKDFFTVLFTSGLSNLIKLAFTVLIGKFIANQLGFEGFLVFGQLNNSLSILYAIMSLGLTNAIVKYSAIYKGESQELHEIISTAVFLNLVSNVLCGVFIVLFSESLSLLVFQRPEYQFVFWLSVLLMPFYSIGQFVLAYLNGTQKFKAIFLINLTISILSGVITIVFIKYFATYGLIFSTVLNLGLYFLIPFLFFRNNITINFFSKWNKVKISLLLKFSLMFIVGATIIPLSNFLQRIILVDSLSSDIAGLWESLNRFSFLISTISSSILSMYLIPKYSTLVDRDTIKRFVRKTFLLITFGMFFLIILLVVIKNELVLAFYNVNFLSLSDLLPIQLVGDFFRVISLVFVYFLITKEKLWIYFTGEIIIGVIQVFFTWIFIKHFNVNGAVYSYALSYLLFFVFHYLIFSSRLKYE